MGTRHLICVFYKGRFVVAQYGQWDGYPENQGVTVLNFLRVPTNIQRLKDGLEHTRERSEEFLESTWAVRSEETSDGLCDSLSRDTGGKILEIISQATAEEEVSIVLNLTFANDCFCEWVYVVDLDTEVLEIFASSVKKTPGHRFQHVGTEDDRVPDHVLTFKFFELQGMEAREYIKRACQALEGKPWYMV